MPTGFYDRKGVNTIIQDCPTCGKTFKSFKSNKKKFCSEDCYYINLRGQKRGIRKIRICPVCNKSFETLKNSPSICCSTNCVLIKQGSQNKICPICKKEFISYKSKPQIHCSRICSVMSMWEKRICPTCGKSFETQKSSDKRYCSRNCYKRYLDINNNEVRICPICKKEFKVKKSMSKIFCSTTCAHKDPKEISQRIINLRNNRRKKPTKPQTKLLLLIKYLYPDKTLIFEHKLDNLNYSIDVAIPELMLGFEYDEQYWHKKSITTDKKRHLEIESRGWNLTHYESEAELKNIVPIEVWKNINSRIKKTRPLERTKIIELCKDNIFIKDILNTIIIFNENEQNNITTTSLIKKCPCGKIFEYYKSKDRKYCSRECSDKFRNRNPKQDNKRIIQPCPTCGIEFKSLKSRHKKFCSRKCVIRTKIENKWISKKCPICENIFKFLKSKNTKYCSQKCASIGLSRLYLGKHKK